MKLAGNIILILLMGTMSFSKNMIMLDYELNKDYIAANLCINKARPALKCHGKCQVMKKMAEEEQNIPGQQKAPQLLQEVLFSESLTFFSLPEFLQTPIEYRIRNEYSDYNKPLRSIFHPPSLA